MKDEGEGTRQALSTQVRLRDLDMRLALLAVVLAALASGCVTGGAGGPGNPNLAAPKLVVQPRQDGNVTLFVHGAFRDGLYDWINMTVDNATLANRTNVFSLEDAVASPGFFVEVHAAANRQIYLARARIDVNLTSERLL